MPGKFNENDLDRLRDAVNIEDVVSGYVNLKRGSKGDWWGKCPFHTEKTASFHVVPDRGMFYCFGCHKGGNAFTFLMEISGISYPESVQLLSEQTGIEVRQSKSIQSGYSGSDRDILYKINQAAGRIFYRNLSSSSVSADAKKALKYLDQRGLTKDIIREYGLGWSENSWDQLGNELEKRGFSPVSSETCGVLVKKKSGNGYVDRFRGRIMFPIVNLTGQVVGFGGRRLEGVTDEQDIAKYINTSETPVYQKGNTLYGLNVARSHIREKDRLILVEGYTDLLAMIRAGFRETVASLGTAFTARQAHLINRFTNRVTIVYDSDSAGIDAANRAAEIMMINGLEPRIVILPENEDPDTILQNNGAATLHEFVIGGLSYVHFRIVKSTPHIDHESTRDWSQAEKLRVSNSILDVISQIRDPLQKELLLQELSDHIGVSQVVLEKSMSSKPHRKGISNDSISITKFEVLEDDVVERDLIRSLLAYPELIKMVSKDISTESFHNSDLLAIFKILESSYLKEVIIDPATLPEKFSNTEIRAFIADAILMSETLEIEDVTEEVKGCLDKIKLRSINVKIREIEQSIKQKSQKGHSTTKLFKELTELQSAKRLIRS